MLPAKAALAIATAHVLPGMLVVRLCRLGRSDLERWVMAAVVGGPVAAAMYLAALVAESSLVYWTLVLALDVWSLARLYRDRDAFWRMPRSPWALVSVLVLVAVIEGAYLLTTGWLFRPDAGGNLLLDRTLQRDTLFHVGIVLSLTHSYPPELLSTSGVEAAYHAGYHLQVAAWSRFYGIGVLDGLCRVGPVWHMGLLVLSAYVLGRRLNRSDGAAVAVSALVFGSGLGFLFFRSPGVDWWSLVFSDAALVSIFLVNPLLPSLPLLLVGWVCLEDHIESGRKGHLVGCALSFVALLTVKIFLGVQVLGGLVLAAVFATGEGARRLRRATAFIALVSLPVLLLTAFVSGSGNTAIGLRPLEIVRYSMEKLNWGEGVHALTAVGSGGGNARDTAVAAGATLVWVVGFLGLRLLGLGRLARDVSRAVAGVRVPMAWMVLVGFPIALLFRVAPEEATGLSRLEAQNDVVWFATQSGILLWFWTAEAIVALAKSGSFTRRLLAWSLALLAFPATVQHFVYKASLGVDVVPAPLVEAAGKVSDLTKPGEVWVDPPSRVRPSLVAYLAGRPVVQDSYVGYDYMFVEREELDYRRHAVAQFWQTRDPAYASWFLHRYTVKGIFATTDFAVPRAVLEGAELAFSNEAARLYRVLETRPGSTPLLTPSEIPMGTRGACFFGRGWGQPSGSPRVRSLLPGNAALYVPVRGNARLTVCLGVEAPHATGVLLSGGRGQEIQPGQEGLCFERASVSESGLQRLDLDWRGGRPLVVKSIKVEVSAPP